MAGASDTEKASEAWKTFESADKTRDWYEVCDALYAYSGQCGNGITFRDIELSLRNANSNTHLIAHRWPGTADGKVSGLILRMPDGTEFTDGHEMYINTKTTSAKEQEQEWGSAAENLRRLEISGSVAVKSITETLDALTAHNSGDGTFEIIPPRIDDFFEAFEYLSKNPKAASFAFISADWVEQNRDKIRAHPRFAELEGRF